MSHALTVAIHITFLLLWIGSTPALALILRWHGSHGGPVGPAINQVERKLWWFGSFVGMIGTVALGTVAITQNATLMGEPWMHIKLTVATLLIVLTILIGRSMAVASRDAEGYTPSKWLPLQQGAFIFLAVAAVFLVELRVP